MYDSTAYSSFDSGPNTSQLCLPYYTLVRSLF